MKKSNTLGWTIIRSLSGQLDGDYEINNEDGLSFVLTFPIKSFEKSQDKNY